MVVSYVYDAWGQPIEKAGTLASTLGTLNPFRYRGYVYDEETGLYYLRSRYYQARWSRFVNMDVGICASQRVLKQSVYAYCSNQAIACADAEGTDAYWLTDSGNVYGLGHTSLLLEDNDGTWYYFYWGPEDVGIPAWTQAKVIFQSVPVSFDGNGMLDLNAFNSTLKTQKIYARAYDQASLITGDYSRSVDEAKLRYKTYEESIFSNIAVYNVAVKNCMQVSAQVMLASNPWYENLEMYMWFQLAAFNTIPRYEGIAFALKFPTVKVSQEETGLTY